MRSIHVLLLAVLVCGPCDQHAAAGPLKRLFSRGHNNTPSDVCTGPNCPTTGAGNIRVGPNQSIVGDVPQHLWPTQQVTTPATIQTIVAPPTVAAPVPDVTIATVTTAAPANEEEALRKSLTEITAALNATTTRIAELESQRPQVVPTPATPPPAEHSVLVAAKPDPRIDQLVKAVSAIGDKLGIQVEAERPAGDASELVQRLPTLRLAVIEHDGKESSTAEIDFTAIVQKQLGGEE